MKPGDVLLAEAREITSIDLFGTTESGTLVYTCNS